MKTKKKQSYFSTTFVVSFAVIFIVCWVSIPSIFGAQISLTKLRYLTEFPQNNAYLLAGGIMSLILFTKIILRLKKENYTRWFVQRIKEGKIRRNYERQLGLKKGKLKGPWYVKVDSIEDYHNYDNQKLYVCKNDGNGSSFTLFEIRIAGCFEGKNCEVCDKRTLLFYRVKFYVESRAFAGTF